MVKKISAAMLAAAIAGTAAAADFYVPDEQGNRDWTNLAGWKRARDYVNDVTRYVSNIEPCPLIPGTGGDTGSVGAGVMLDSGELNPETPMIIGENLQLDLSSLCIGYFAGPPYAAPGERHTVALTMRPGSSIVFTGNKQFYMASGTNTSALLTMEAGSMITNSSAVVKVGERGEGEIRNHGGSLYAVVGNNAHGVALGTETGGCGRYVQTAGLLNTRMMWLGMGTDGTGIAEISGGSFYAQILYVGYGYNSRGRLALRGDTGGLVLPTVAIGVGGGSRGVMEMHGVRLNLALSNPTLSVRDSAAGDGELRGCGELLNHDGSGQALETVFWMSERLVADGDYAPEGGEKRLDLSKLKSGNSGMYNARRKDFGDGFDTTNGYYAVNGATLCYPGLCNGWASSRVAASIGDTNHEEISPLVNTIHVDAPAECGVFRGQNTMHAKLFAADSPDIPNAASVGGARGSGNLMVNLGVWEIWLQSTIDNPARTAFNSIRTLTFRYDHRGLKPGAKIHLLRYDAAQGRWIRIAAKAHDPEAPYIAAEGVTPQPGDANVGVYAVRTVRSGLLLLVK